MLEIQVFLALLDQVRGEAIEMAEQPSLDKQTGFGFGQVSGIMMAVNRLRQEINTHIEASREAR